MIEYDTYSQISSSGIDINISIALMKVKFERYGIKEGYVSNFLSTYVCVYKLFTFA